MTMSEHDTLAEQDVTPSDDATQEAQPEADNATDSPRPVRTQPACTPPSRSAISAGEADTK